MKKYAALGVVGFLGLIVLVAVTIFSCLLYELTVQPYRIEGHAMEPSLHDGQLLLGNRLAYTIHPPQRGDVIVFHSPQDPRKDFIKRVIGLPGEEVEIRVGQVFVDGTALDEPYLTRPGTRSWGPEVVGEFEYFVLGDNRNNSSDSRSWGMLSGDAIVGKMWFCYWPPQYWGAVLHHSFDATSIP